jgi:hypothetical protein
MLMLRTPAELRAAGVGNDLLAAALSAEGIPAKVLFPVWATLPAFAGIPDDACPAAEAAAEDGVWIHHRMLTDPDFAEDLATAWARLLGGLDQLRTLASHGAGHG